MASPPTIFTRIIRFLTLPEKPLVSLHRWDVIKLKNATLASTFLANIVAVVLMDNLIFWGGPLPSAESMQTVGPFGDAFRVSFGLLIAGFALLYEKPIRRRLQDIYRKQSTPDRILEDAQRRLLNEPFWLMGINLLMWIAAAFFFSFLFKDLGESFPVVLRVFLLSINTGLITAVMCFFLLEHTVQNHVAPYFFPHGGLYRTKKTIRNRFVLRLLALLFACNIIPFLSFIQLHFLTAFKMQPAEMALQELRTAILSNSIFFIVVGLSLTLFVHVNFMLPLNEIIQALKDIRHGNLDRQVFVTTNDEIGYTGDVINEMTAGLKERERLRQSVDLAREVQQSMLPSENPRVVGLDIAGNSRYCDETGGDYYDFFDLDSLNKCRLAVVVGDVSDHGLQSALMMISARACIRHNAQHMGDIAEIIADVNDHIYRDMEFTGHFMTMFLCEVDPNKKFIRWVRAGHDPGLLYDPSRDVFDELAGEGLALGIFKRLRFEALSRDISSGQIIAIGTDGIWEANNPSGERFGKKRFRELIRRHHRAAAAEIVELILAELHRFAGQQPIADDVTLVVIKVLN